MPQIYRYFGLIFYFWSDDHLPAHVHVTDTSETRETVFDLILENSILIEMKMRTDRKPPLKPEEVTKAKAFIGFYYPQIVKKWFQYFVCGEKLKSVTVTKKVAGEVEIEDTVQHMEELKKKFYPTVKKQPNKTISKKSKK